MSELLTPFVVSDDDMNRERSEAVLAMALDILAENPYIDSDDWLDTVCPVNTVTGVMGLPTAFQWEVAKLIDTLQDEDRGAPFLQAYAAQHLAERRAVDTRLINENELPF